MMKKTTKAEREAAREQMRANAAHTRELAEQARAVLDRKGRSTR